MNRPVPKSVPPPPPIVKPPAKVHKVHVTVDVPTREEFIAAYLQLKPRFTVKDAGDVYDILCGPNENFGLAMKEWAEKFSAEQKLNDKKL
jgi:hypothetical protein